MSRASSKRKSSLRGSKVGKRGIVAKIVARLLVWLTLAGIFCLLFYGSYWGVKRVFFASNPHFILQKLDINVSGQLERAEVIALLTAQGIEPETTNLFSDTINLKRIRQSLEDHILIDSATVSRQFPDTLQIAIFERQPLAKLGRFRSKLIDMQGTILPPRKDTQDIGLPIITGVRNTRKLETGMQSDDPLLLAALKTLIMLATRPSGNFYDVILVQLDYSSETLKYYLRERPPFRKGAHILLPSTDIEAALQRLDVVVNERYQAGQKTSFIDATYVTNVPTKP